MIIHDCEQRSEEWHQLRIGRITGTKFKEMVTGKTSTFELLCRKIAAEKLTGISCDKPLKITDAMQHGINMEDEARAAYSLECLVSVNEVGFVSLDELFGISPDGIVEDLQSGLEIKCPLASTHLGYLMSPESLVRQYNWQVQGALWVTGFSHWDIMSYCPDFPAEKRILIVSVPPNKDDQDKIHNAAVKLEARVFEILESLQ